MLMDQMTQPLDRAVWWIEYAMRYPGMKHMRSPVHDLHWTQYFLLDVIAFILLVVISVIAIFVTCCKCCYRKCCSSNKVKSD
jgi:glucuronosyltransferase